MPIKTAQLVIHDPHHSKKAGEILIQPAQETEGADLFVLIEIDSAEPHDYQFIEQFLETANLAYQNSQISNTEKSLELILQKLNQEIETISPKQKNWSNKFHCAVALISNNQLFFSTIGKIKVYLIKPTLIKKIVDHDDGEYKFSHTLNGALKTEDKILISTDNLLNYISLDKIKKTISTLPPKSAVAHFSNILQATSPEISFFSIILQARPTEEIENLPIPVPSKLTSPSTSKNSLDQLLSVKRETEKILTPPSFVQSIKDRVKKKNAPIPQLTQKKGSVKQVARKKRPGTSIKLISDFKLSFNVLKKIWPAITSVLTPKKKIGSILEKIVRNFKRLSKTNRILILAIIILLLLFSQNLIWQSKQQVGVKSEEFYQNLLGEIENKQNGIEASLIYNDTVRAKQLLEEIYIILEDFPQNSKERIAKFQQTSEEIQIIYERIWKVTNILDPLILVDFATINPAVNTHHISIRDERLYGFNNSSQLYTYDLANNEKIIIDNYDINLVNIDFFPKTNQIIGYNPSNDFYSLAENETENISVSLPSSLNQIDDLTFFLDKMYLLDRSSNQIYRLTQSGKNFTSARSWIKDSSPVNQAVSMAVDGYLFLLLENGQIQRFASGNKRDFATKINVEPELTAPTKIYTDADANYLYILDPVNNRFVVLDKNGEVKNQYYSDKFDDLKDFVVKESDKKVYLLNGNQVYVVAVQ